MRQKSQPKALLRSTPVLSGVVVQPRLRTRNESRGHSSMPVASTSAMPTGLFAHIPPSTSGIPAEERCVGKYVGAAAVESATSTTLVV